MSAELEALRAQLHAMAAEILSDDYPPPMPWVMPDRTWEPSFSGGECSKHGRYYGHCHCCENERKRASDRYEYEWQLAKRDRLKVLAQAVTP